MVLFSIQLYSGLNVFRKTSVNLHADQIEKTEQIRKSIPNKINLNL